MMYVQVEVECHAFVKQHNEQSDYHLYTDTRNYVFRFVHQWSNYLAASVP